MSGTDVVERAENWLRDVRESRWAKTLVEQLVSELKTTRVQRDQLVNFLMLSPAEQLAVLERYQRTTGAGAG